MRGREKWRDKRKIERNMKIKSTTKKRKKREAMKKEKKDERKRKTGESGGWKNKKEDKGEIEEGKAKVVKKATWKEGRKLRERLKGRMK